MKIDRRFPPTWSAAHDRLYRTEWAAVLRMDPRADRRALTIKALGAYKCEWDFTDIEFAKVLEVFRSISRPHDLLSLAEALERRRTHLLFTVRRLATRTGAAVGAIDDLSEGALNALRISLSEQLAGRRIAA